MDTGKLMGFIYKHLDGTYSLWGTDISEEDAQAIGGILDKYQSEGCSVRGNLDDLNLTDVL